jgi:hypothetical protein
MMLFDYNDANRRLEDLRHEAELERRAAQVERATRGQRQSVLSQAITLLARISGK